MAAPAPISIRDVPLGRLVRLHDGRLMTRRRLSAAVELVLIGPRDKVGRTGPKAYVSIVANMQALTRARWSGGLLVPVQPICLCFRP